MFFLSAGGYKRLLSKPSCSCFQANSVGMGLGLMVGNAVMIFHYGRQSQHQFKTSNCNTSLPSLRAAVASNTKHNL